MWAVCGTLVGLVAAEATQAAAYEPRRGDTGTRGAGPMVRRGRVIAVLLTAAVVGLIVAWESMPVKVHAGQRYICCDCGKEYRSKITALTVSRFQSHKYRVSVDSSRACPHCTVAVRTGHKTVCPDCRKVILDATTVIYVPKSKAAGYSVERTEKVCETCQRERERLDRIVGTLFFEFGIPAIPPVSGKVPESTLRFYQRPEGAGPYVEREAKGPPGGSIIFSCFLLNGAPEPIEDPIRIVIQPVDHLEAADGASLAQLGSTGLRVCERLLPYKSPYYQPEGILWSSRTSFPPVEPGDQLRFTSLKLKSALSPGEDVEFSGHLRIGTRDVPMGTVTVHVMHPSQ
jgi:hypothetical protein